MAAASVTTMQSYLTSGPMVAGLKSYRTSVSSIPCKLRSMRIRCQAEEKKRVSEEQEQPATPVNAPPQPVAQTPPPKPKVSTKFSDILAFSGPAPERINGRLAMIGFVAALGAELARGDDLAAQLANGAFPWFVATAVIFSAASLVPLFKGVTVQSKSGGLMTADAELWNGRFAMLGLVALAFTEYVKGGPLV